MHVELQGADVAAIQARALELAQFEVQHVKQLAATQAEYRQLLAAPDEFADEEEEADVAQEFHPHQQDGQPGKFPERGAAPTAASPLPPPPPPPPVPAPAPPSGGEPAASKGEGEQRSDPTNAARSAGPSTASAATSAPAGSAPPAEKSSASAAPTPATAATEPAPRTMPAAERRLTAPPSPGADVPLICNMLHELGVSWTQVRDRHEGRGEEIADACGIFGTPGMVIPDLGLSVRNQLRTHLEALVAEKRAKAARKEAKKEANRTRKEAVAS